MIFFDGKSERSADFRLLAPDAEVVMQEGTDLGERLSKAFDRAFAAGCSSVAIIGTDFPHMPVKRIEETFHLLNHNKADAVFGPSEDGGYYLVAMNKLHPGLFRDIPWSSPDTLARSLAKAASLKLTAELLTPGFDLDTVGDLLRLKKETLPVAPRTLSFLSRIMP
jgi:rSAM/selenodomain-associated transferase 1